MVGASFDADGNPRGYIWRKGVMTDLNHLIAGTSPLYLLWASVNNARGEIVGYGATSTGDIHGFLATPVTQNAASTAQDSTSRMVLSNEVRKLVRQRLPGRRAAM